MWLTLFSISIAIIGIFFTFFEFIPTPTPSPSSSPLPFASPTQSPYPATLSTTNKQDNNNNDNNNENDNNDNENDKFNLKEAISRIKFDLFQPQNVKIPFQYTSSNTIQIERVNWIGNETIINAVVSNQPIIINSSPVTTWPALKWDLWNLALEWPVLFDVIVQDKNTLLTFYEDLENNKIGNDEQEYKIIPEMIFANFLYQSPNVSHYFYYSTNYVVMEKLSNLTKDTSWTDFRIIESFDDIITRLNVSEQLKDQFLQQPSPILSISHPGVTLQTRYQESHIMRVQLTGSSRYVLFPPGKHSQLSLYPAIHSCHKQSQIVLEDYLKDSSSDLIENDNNNNHNNNNGNNNGNGNDQSKDIEENNDDNLLNVQNFVATLSPGEVLYIPPYWLVRTESLELSTTLDIKSLSREQVLLSEVQSLGVILGNVSSREERIVAAQVYAIHFLSRVTGLVSPEQYSIRHYRSRYSSLYPSNGLFMTQLKKSFTCLRDNPTLHTQILTKLDRNGIKASAQYAADRINDKSIPKGIKWMWIGDYIDFIARWAMNDAQNAVGFITTCLKINKKVPLVNIEEVPGPPIMVLGDDKDKKE